jgi:hypothetical protein
MQGQRSQRMGTICSHISCSWVLLQILLQYAQSNASVVAPEDPSG